jgi:hypothetical protein
LPSRAEYYRAEAERLRREAEIATEDWIRHQFLEIAQRYDSLAETMRIVEREN